MGAYRSQPDKSKITLGQKYEGIQFAVSHMCGWRLYMEDASIEQFNFDLNKNHIFAIFDGHGGGEVAAFVKKHFAEELKKNTHYLQKNYQLALEQNFEKMDQLLKSEQGKNEIQEIQNRLKQQDNLPKRDFKHYAGCTALVCLLTDRSFYIANAGDSQAFMKKNGSFQCLNTLHCPLQAQQQKRIQNAGGIVTSQGRINGNLNVSRGIGDLEFKSNKRLSSQKQIVISLPDIIKQSQEGVQYIFMGCDGIWEEKDPEEIRQFIDERMQKNMPLDKVLEEMLEWLICEETDVSCKQLGKDNMSAILIKL